jgi:hypothetical protein
MLVRVMMMMVDAKEKQYQKKKRLSAVWVLIV